MWLRPRPGGGVSATERGGSEAFGERGSAAYLCVTRGPLAYASHFHPAKTGLGRGGYSPPVGVLVTIDACSLRRAASMGHFTSVQPSGFCSPRVLSAVFKSYKIMALARSRSSWSSGPRADGPLALDLYPAGSQGAWENPTVDIWTKAVEEEVRQHDSNTPCQDRADSPADLLHHIRRHTYRRHLPEITSPADSESKAGCGGLPDRIRLGRLSLLPVPKRSRSDEMADGCYSS